jgi:hypothetical protein
VKGGRKGKERGKEERKDDEGRVSQGVLKEGREERKKEGR